MAAIMLAAMLFLLSAMATAQSSRDKFDKLLTQYRQLNWSGVLVAGNKKGIQYQQAFGYANHETKQPMKADTWFKTESAGKMFTAVRILQLVAAGKLNFDQTLAQLLPDWKIPNNDQINIRHLLTHTSGLSSQWEHPDYEFGKVYTDAQIKKFIEEAPVAFQTPGEKSYYSNSGYVMMGEIISRIDGVPYEQSMQQHIFQPAGMTHTRSLRDSVLPQHAAQPYYQVTATRFAHDDTKYGDGLASGAGGWMSTAGDMFRFAQAYLNEKLLPRKWMDVQVTNDHQVDTSSKFRRYGMALLSTRPAGHFVLGHNGGGKGFTADVFFDYYKGDIVVFLSNQYGVAYDLTGKAFAVLNGLPYKDAAHPDRIKVAEWIMSKQASQPLTADVLAALQVQPNDFLYFAVFDNLTELGEHQAAKVAIEAGRAHAPKAAYMWLKSGENAAALGDNAKAREYFSQANVLATADKDDALVKMIQNKVDALVSK